MYKHIPTFIIIFESVLKVYFYEIGNLLIYLLLSIIYLAGNTLLGIQNFVSTIRGS
jgi:hypothetical protein